MQISAERIYYFCKKLKLLAMSSALVLVPAARASAPLCRALRATWGAILHRLPVVFLNAATRPLADGDMGELGRLIGCAHLIQCVSLRGHTAVSPEGWAAFLAGAVKNPNLSRLVLKGSCARRCPVVRRARGPARGRDTCAFGGEGVLSAGGLRVACDICRAYESLAELCLVVVLGCVRGYLVSACVYLQLDVRVYAFGYARGCIPRVCVCVCVCLCLCVCLRVCVCVGGGSVRSFLSVLCAWVLRCVSVCARAVLVFVFVFVFVLCC